MFYSCEGRTVIPKKKITKIDHQKKTDTRTIEEKYWVISKEKCQVFLRLVFPKVRDLKCNEFWKNGFKCSMKFDKIVRSYRDVGKKIFAFKLTSQILMTHFQQLLIKKH